MTSDEFWESLRQAIEAPNSLSVAASRMHQAEFAMTAKIQAQSNLGVVNSTVGLDSTQRSQEGTGRIQTVTISSPGRVGVIEHLKKHPHTIIIDDYHWLNPDLLPDIFPPLKQALGLGSKVVLISVSKSVFPSTGDLSDFNGRVLSIEMPSWEHAEIQEIARLGFQKLNVVVTDETIFHLDNCSYFSPLLMQGLCNNLCYEHGVLETCDERTTLPSMTRKEMGELAARFAKPLTVGFDDILTQAGEKKWLTKDRDGRLLSMTEVFILGISARKPFEPAALSDVVKRVKDRILHGLNLPENLPAALAAKAVELQKKLGGVRGDRSPIFYDSAAQTITIVDPYFKLWARWVRGPEISGKLFLGKGSSQSG